LGLGLAWLGVGRVLGCHRARRERTRTTHPEAAATGCRGPAPRRPCPPCTAGRPWHERPHESGAADAAGAQPPPPPPLPPPPPPPLPPLVGPAAAAAGRSHWRARPRAAGAGCCLRAWCCRLDRTGLQLMGLQDGLSLDSDARRCLSRGAPPVTPHPTPVRAARRRLNRCAGGQYALPRKARLDLPCRLTTYSLVPPRVNTGCCCCCCCACGTPWPRPRSDRR
jgi:hypothetical protein